MNTYRENAGIKINSNLIAVTLILIAEVCFFTINTIYIYLLFSGIGMLISFIHNIKRFSMKVKKSNFILWITFVYFIYFLYGFFYLQRGEFPWDTLAYRFFESIAIYVALRQEVRVDPDKIAKSFLVAGIFSFIYLIIMEKNDFIQGGMRIGSSLSGNVNTVGYNFGIINTIIIWWYCRNKKWWKMLFIIIFSGIMLLTGSKKVLITLILDFLLLFMYERGKASRWLKLGLILTAGIYVVFNVPYVYEIIGIRIESMFETLLLGNSAQTYSYSTDVRSDMIKEGFRLFGTRPVLGGGWNYFYANTIYGYEYSHNNYIEILCSFGIVGFLIYYSKHFRNLVFAIKRIFNHKYLCFDYLILAFIYTVLAVTLDWASVSFSAQCVWYIPVIVSSAIIDEIRDIESRGEAYYEQNCYFKKITPGR